MNLSDAMTGPAKKIKPEIKKEMCKINFIVNQYRSIFGGVISPAGGTAPVVLEFTMLDWFCPIL